MFVDLYLDNYLMFLIFKKKAQRHPFMIPCSIHWRCCSYWSRSLDIISEISFDRLFLQEIVLSKKDAVLKKVNFI